MSTRREKKCSNACIRCVCCCYCVLILLLVIAACLFYYFYTTEKPKAPTYEVQSVMLKSLDVQSDLSLETNFMVDVKTTNPNKNIGFIYGADSNISLVHNHAIISSGKLPAFEQDPANTTVLRITLSGNSENEFRSLHGASGEVPLVVHVRVPVKVFVGNVTSVSEFMASVSCDLVLDKLELGKMAKVLKTDCEPDVEF